MSIHLLKKTIPVNFRILAVLIAAFLITPKVDAQCPPGDVTLSTQAQVNQFLIDYPNCTQITGNLTIADGSNPSTDVTNLAPLSNLTTVTGGVGIFNNPFLANLNGLNITNVGGATSIEGNPVLQHINGLNSITSIGGAINIANNVSLQNIDGLSSISSIGGFLQFNNNGALQNVDGLNGITSIGGILQISNNGALQNIDGLTNVTTINGIMTIAGNSVLNDITGIQNVDQNTITELYIENNPQVAVCNIPNVCSFLSTTKPRIISGNLTNCQDEATVVAACSATAGGCLTTSATLPQWPAATYTPTCSGTAETIADDAYTGEYSKVQVTAGNTYTFSSSVATDHVTISNENGTTVYTAGTQSVVWTAAANETIRFYLHLDDECNWGDNVDRSRIVNCSSLGINDLHESQFVYYPNPMKDVLTVSSEKAIAGISVFDITGREVINNAPVSNGKVDVAALGSGTYVFRVTLDGGAIETFKITKD